MPLDALPEEFRSRYRELYGVAPDGSVEVAAFRVRLRVPVERPPLEAPASQGADAIRVVTRPAWFGMGDAVETRIVAREQLPGTGAIAGPAVIEGPVDTLVVPPGWTAEVDGTGSIQLRKKAD
jgi:N-methylhydantoinase A